MKRKFLVFLLCTCTVLSLTACSNPKGKIVSTDSKNNLQSDDVQSDDV